VDHHGLGTFAAAWIIDVVSPDGCGWRGIVSGE
jgi:hypothetical protein